MKRSVLFSIAAVVSIAFSARASEEDFLRWRSVDVDCFETSQTGKVRVSARAGNDGIVSFKAAAFGKSFSLAHSDLEKIRSFPLESLKATHEAGYPQLGGHTVHFRLHRTYYDKEEKRHDVGAVISISKGKGLETRIFENPKGN